MDTSFLTGIVFAASALIAAYFSAACIALLALLACLGKNARGIKYDCIAILLPPVVWLTLAFAGVGQKSISDLEELFTLGGVISALAVLRVLSARVLKRAPEAYAAFSLLAVMGLFILGPNNS
jgi:hypothetical protein